MCQPLHAGELAWPRRVLQVPQGDLSSRPWGSAPPAMGWRSQTHLQCLVLQLELLILIRVTLRELVDADAVVVDLLPDLEANNALRAGPQPREGHGRHRTGSMSPQSLFPPDQMSWTPPNPSKPQLSPGQTCPWWPRRQHGSLQGCEPGKCSGANSRQEMDGDLRALPCPGTSWDSSKPAQLPSPCSSCAPPRQGSGCLPWPARARCSRAGAGLS